MDGEGVVFSPSTVHHPPSTDLQAPVSSRACWPYEGLPSTCPPAQQESAGGVEPPGRGFANRRGAAPLSPLPTSSGRGGSRTLKASLLGRFRDGCHRRWLACPSVALSSSCGGRTRTCTLLVNSEMPYRWTTPQTVSEAGFEPALSCSQGRRVDPATPLGEPYSSRDGWT